MANKRNLTIAPSAIQDLTSAWSYTATFASYDIADNLILEITARAMRILEHPFLGRSRSDAGTQIRSFPAPPYTVFYRATAKTIEIVRVLHERQDFEHGFESA